MGKGINLKKGIRRLALFVTLFMLISVSAIAGFALSNNFSKQSAYAVDLSYTKNGGYVESVDRAANKMVYKKDNILTLLGRIAGKPNQYGDFIKEGAGMPLIVGSEETGDENGYLRINELSTDLKLVSYIGIDSASEFAEAILDELVIVKIIPYFVYANRTYADGADLCDYTVTYYSGKIDYATGDPVPVYYSNKYTNTFGDEDQNDPNAKKSAGSLTLPTEYIAANNPYIKIELSNFQKVDLSFSIAIKTMGFTVQYQSESNVAIEPKAEQTAVVNLDGNRDVTAINNMVKANDIICLTTYIQKGATALALNQTSTGTGSVNAGKFFRKLFLTDDASSRTIIEYTYSVSQLTKIVEYENLGVTHDISDDFSGQQIYFMVMPSTRAVISITAKLWRFDGIEMGVSRTFTYYMDSLAANSPMLSTSSPFYNKYIDAGAYFTNKLTYKTESVPKGDGTFITKIRGVDLALSDAKPLLTPESIALRGGDIESGVLPSAQIVYYRVRKLAADEDIPTYGQASEGFDRADAHGVYCTVQPDGTIFYTNLYLPLKEIIGEETIYNTNGIFSIEFTTYDLVGNKAVGNITYFVKVDVADYAFTYKFQLGDGTTQDKQVTQNDVTLSFATLSDSGVLSAYTSEPIFKRGDKISVMAKFTATGYSAFILTYFKTTGVGMATTDSSTTEWNGYFVKIKQSGQLYTFEVNTMFTENPTARALTLIFKEKATIEATNVLQTYDGTGKSIKAQLKIGGSTIISGINISVFYSVDNITFTTVLPINAGNYYFKCELLNHSRYYAIKTGNFTISQANPNINGVAISAIDYGSSLASVDFDENVYMTTNGLSQKMSTFITCFNFNEGRYYYYKSADSIIGYYKISGMEKTSQTYIKPSAGTLTLTIQFFAIKYTIGAGDTIVFSTTPVGLFIRDENYAVVAKTISIKVNNSNKVNFVVANLNGDNKVYYDYDGSAKPLIFNLLSTLPAETGLNLTTFATVKYKNITENENGDYVLDVPSISGRYLVSVEVNQARCNYMGSFIQELVIKKKQLNVESGDISCLYQAEKNPTAVASLGSGLNKVIYNGLKYKFTYYYYNSAMGSYNEMAIAENKVEEEFLFDKVPVNAGVYVVKVALDEINYENTFDVFVKLTITKVATGNTRLSISYPSLGFNISNLDSHITYLQPLSQVAVSSNWNVRYTYHVYKNNRLTETVLPVEGRFIVVSRMYTGLDGEGNAQTQAQYIVEMENYNKSTTGAKLMYLCFVPATENLKNFDFIYKECEVVVGKARAEFTNVNIQNIIYGKEIKSITDINIAYSVRILISGSGINATYYTLPYEDINLGYTLSLSGINNDNPKMFEVGSHFVDVVFTPKDTNNFETTTTSRTITVEKRTLGIIFGTEKLEVSSGMYVYTYKGYVSPSVAFSNKVNSADIVGGSFSYFFLSSGLPCTDTYLKVNSYRVDYTINNANYKGTASFNCRIDKDTLIASQSPNIYEEGTAVSYNKLLKNVVFSNGIMLSRNTNEQVSGTYKLQCGDDERFLDTGIRRQYPMYFLPTDSQNYEGYGLDGNYKIYLTVAKADISSGITLSIPTFTYGELNYNFLPSSIISYTTSIWTDGNNYAESKLNGSYNYLAVTYILSNLPTSGKLSAGKYRATIYIADDNYTGSKSGNLVINKKQAYISVLSNDKIFSNKSQTVTASVSDDDGLINENILQVFYKNNLKMDSIPSEIGKYDVVLTLSSNNYVANAVSTTLIIRVDASQITITNTEQVYTIQRNLGVSLGLNTAVYNISFFDALNNRIYQTMPTNAGSYEIRLTFLADDNDGYSDVISYAVPLVINKFTARIIVASNITTVYTNRRFAINYYTDPYGLNITKTYLAEGASTYAENEVYEAGTHKIKLTIVDDNYKGEAIIDYYILPGDLSIARAPEFGQYVYNSNTKPALINDGAVDFGTTERNVEGTFNINLEEIKYLNAGVHTIKYTFVATHEGVVNKNYNTIQGQISIIIVKSTISGSAINIGTNSGFYVNYDGKYHGVDANLSDGVVYDNNGINSDLILTIYYNGVTNLPREKGEYTVKAVISSKNYTGEKIEEQKFVIDFGNPQIRVNPTLLIDDFGIGDTITTADITGGKAYLVGTNTQINGRFVVTTTTFTKANINKVQVQFEPELLDLYNIVVFEINVNVRGEDSLGGAIQNGDWTDAIFAVNHGGTNYGTVKVVVTPKSGVVYGVKVSDFDISFQNITTIDSDPKAYLESFGLLTFAPNSNIINVGEKVKIVFTPAGSNADTYNIMYGFVSLGIEKADLPYNVVYSLKGFIGKDLTLQNRVFKLLINSSILDIEGTLTLYQDNAYSVLFEEHNILTLLDNNRTIYLSYITNNYNEVRRAINLEIYDEIDSSSIILGINSKSYDGIALTASSLNVSVINTQLPVDSSAISIRILDSFGLECAGINVGTYTIFVYVNDINYYGSASYTFVVNKRDVTNSISLSQSTTVYDTITAPAVKLSGETINSTEYKMYYKEANALDSTYTLNLPVNAGNYKIKIVINNDIYEGIKVFDFLVQKLEVRMIASQIYSYVYGSNLAPIISFKYKDSETILSLDYEVFYYADNYTLTKNLPFNAGMYKGRVFLIDDNYTLNLVLGYAEFNYEITKMISNITTLPSVIAISVGGVSYNLKYGQRLNEVRLSGGEATRNGIAVQGSFSVSNGTNVLNAGTHNVAIIFTPVNSNYATATANVSIYIAPADATVSFSVLRAQYNGNARKSAIVYSVAPIGVGVTLSFINSQGETVLNPINAGNYSVVVTSNDSNYVVSSSFSLDGLTSPIFVISKAEPNEVKIINPKANSISVGESLDKSTLSAGINFGLIYYKNFTNPVEGTFHFVQSSLVYMTAGTFAAEYYFVPIDSNNFANYRGVTEITIKRASATISVSNNIFTYGCGFTKPTFVTFPAGLTVNTDITFNEYNINSPNYVYRNEDIVDVGTYYFNVWVNDPNYLVEKLEFPITIKKKVLDMNFVDSTGNILTQYSTTYGKIVDANFILYDVYNTGNKSGYLLKDKVINGIKITDTYNINYRSTSGTNVYNSHNAPSERGTYYVTVDLINKNYSATNTITYKIERGVIETIEFDQFTLEKQTYGSNIVDPIITTSPFNISYYIVYQGHNTTRPKDAGSYNITVYFNDDNYDKKQVSAMFKIGKKELDIINIDVKDKVYDGVASLQISGELKGVLFKDEVTLRMSATTLDNDIKVGYHYVTITNYELIGLQASNYTVKKPSYNLQVKISANKVESPANTSFITSGSGFNEGTTVDFKTLLTSANKTNIISKSMGTQSTIIGFSIKENGAETILKDQFKVYLAIPTEYLGTDFDVEATGNLAGQTIIFAREGDYITFYASSSGQVVFTKSEFKYTFVVVFASLVIIIIGVFVLFILNPIQRKSKTQSMDNQKAAIRKIKRGY